jgi:vacuolar protein sorting-associated protein 8
VASCLLECLDFSGFNFVYAEFSLSRSGTETSERKSCMTFQNSVKYSDDRIMILCQNELRCISIVGARRRVSTLEADGEWLEALAFALDHYENTVLNLEDRRRDPNGKVDLSRHPEFSVAKSEDEEWIAKLLVRYLNLAVENAPETSSDRSTIYSSSDTSGRIDLALSHYQMLAGVCVDYCVLIRRLDLLFGPIFRRFESVGYIAVFLDVLEPYVLNDKLTYIAPEVMGLFVEHCKATTSIATVERCLLHMDCTIMDFDSILQLLRTNKMFSALFYVFNNGLDDYVSPLEILLDRVFDEADAGGVPLTRRPDGVLQTDFERLGYKALLYLQSCFTGKSFPQGKMIKREDRVASIKMELLKFLMQERFKASVHTKKAINLLPEVGQRHTRFPYLRLLLLVDPRGMLETIAIALDTYGGLRFATTASVSSDEWMHGGHEMRQSSIDIQRIVMNLATIFIPKSLSDQSHTEAAVFEARGAVDTFLDFASNYIIDGSVRLDRAITLKIIMRFATQHTNAEDVDSRSAFQRKVMDVLSALPRDAYDPDLVLQIFQETHMHRAALLLHQQVASSWSGSGEDEFAIRSRHFISAIDSFVGDEDPEFRTGVFGYVKKECSATEENGYGTLRDCLFQRMSTLVHLDPVQTARLTAELFVDDLDKVIDSLNKEQDQGESLFLFLNVIVSGDLAAVDNAAASVLNLSMEHHHQYLSLLARLHPNLVYDYLATHDNYRTEDCLRLCQEHDIADASAYLLERTGNVSAALQLILQTLETRMMGLKRTIRGLGIDIIRKQHMLSFGRTMRSHVTLPSKQEAEIDNVRRILTVALDVCERNSGNFAISRAGEAAKFSRGDLWFNVLDRLINAKGFLRLTKEQPEHANIMANVLSELLRSTMQRMVSSVPLSDIVRKVTSDNSGSRIGELREMVEGLLAAYNFELNVFKGASTVFNKDLTAMRNVQVEVCNRGDSVNTIMNTPLEANRHEITTKLLQHPLYQRGMLQITGPNKAVFTTNDRHASNATESGLVDGVRKLRNRRRRTTTSAIQSNSSSSRPLSVSLMTATERLYEAHEIEPVLYSERLVGILGAAENQGRITSFYQ